MVLYQRINQIIEEHKEILIATGLAAIIATTTPANTNAADKKPNKPNISIPIMGGNYTINPYTGAVGIPRGNISAGPAGASPIFGNNTPQNTYTGTTTQQTKTQKDYETLITKDPTNAALYLQMVDEMIRDKATPEQRIIILKSAVKQKEDGKLKASKEELGRIYSNLVK